MHRIVPTAEHGGRRRQSRALLRGERPVVQLSARGGTAGARCRRKGAFAYHPVKFLRELSVLCA